VSSLEHEITQAEAAIGDAKNALQKLLVDKEESSRRIESLEEDNEHAQATIEAMTKSMTQAREEYEAKIDSLMSGLATAREVHAARSVAGDTRSMALTTTESSRGGSGYTMPDSKSTYTSWRDRNKSYTEASTRNSSKLSDDNKPSARDRAISSSRSVHTLDRADSAKDLARELAVDIDNMTIASAITEADLGSKVERSSASSLTRFNQRSKSVGRDRSVGRAEHRSTSMYDSDSRSVVDSKLSNLDLARSFLNGKPGAATSTSRSRSRPRVPQDRDTFGDDSDARSVGGKSLGGASFYDANKSRSGSNRFGGKYVGDLNSRGERNGYGTFVADNGNEYEGEWKNDKREGHGKAKYNTGDVYIGNWVNCKRHGLGTMYIENGDVYEGNWQNGFKDGPGTYRWRDGELDISRYSSDYRVGEGVRWSEDRRRAFRLVRGNVQEEISLGEAERIADDLGLPVP
jgi:hypothetical protein